MTRPFFLTWNRQDSATLNVQSAEHDEFVLTDGTRIYDFLSTSFQTSFGHNHPLIVERIKKQLEQMPIASTRAEFDLKEQVSHKLLELLGRQNKGRLFFTVSGAESVENALKIARQIKNRKKILARNRSYHGASLGALSVTGDWRNTPHFTCDKETIRIPEPHDDPDCEQTRRIIIDNRDSIAAFILETITGANGVIIPPESWFVEIQKLCFEYDIFLILDEVLCGFGRTGKPFAFHHYNLQPDMICMAKGMSGGYIPFGAVWTSPAIAEYYDERILACGLTNYAHPLGLAATDAVIDLLNDAEFQTSVTQLESSFEENLQNLKQLSIVKEIRHRGLLAALEFDCDAPTWDMAITSSLHFLGKGNLNVLAPPLISSVDRLQRAFGSYEQLLNSFKF